MDRSNQKNLAALGLFTLAQQHYQKAHEFEKALAEYLGYPPGETYMGLISDALTEGGAFETALHKEGRESQEQGK